MTRLAERSFAIDFAIDAVPDGNGHDLRVRGDLTPRDAHAVYDALDDATLRRPPAVTVDLREADTALPTLLAVLVRATRLGRTRRVTVRVVAGDHLREAIDRRGLRQWVHLVDG